MQRSPLSLYLRLMQNFPSNGHQRVTRTREGIELNFREDKAFRGNQTPLITADAVGEIAQAIFPSGVRVNDYPEDKRMALHFEDAPRRFVTIHAPYTAPHLTIGFGKKDGDLTTPGEIKDYMGFTWGVYLHCIEKAREARRQGIQLQKP